MFLDIDGNKFFALSFGKGHQTFLAHSGWIGNFEDWIAALGPLSANWRAVIYDHRGAGETQVSLDAITPEALVDDVFAVMDALSINRCVIGGFSKGTETVLRAVIKHPERFEGMVLMSGCGEILPPDAPRRPAVAPSNWPGETFSDHLNWFAEMCLPEPDSGHIRRWGINILSRSTPEVADRIFTMQHSEPVDWPTRLGELDIPTLLIHGDRDAFYDVERMKYAQSLIPRSELVVLEGTGHLPAMTRPDEVAGAIDRFFAGSN